MTAYAALLEGHWLIVLIITLITTAIMGLYLMLTTSTIEQQTKYDYRVDKKTRELVDLVESKGYRLENTT